MPDNSSLYPQPPQQGVGLLSGDPSKLIGLAAQMQQIQLMRQQMPALAQQPQANLQGTNIANAAAQMQQQAEARKIISGEMGSAINGMENPTADDIHSLTAYISRSHPEISQRYPDLINAASDVALKNPKGIKYGGGLLLNMGISPESASGRVAGPPTASGAPTTNSMAQANMAGSIQIDLPPGEKEAMAANRSEFVNDQGNSANILAKTRRLQNALPIIAQLSNSNFGPGSPELAKIKGALTTAGIIDPNTSDLQLRQEAGKYLLGYAQDAQHAGRSDNALSAALGSNPNLDLTQPANLALIKNQIGMDRMDASLPLAFRNGDRSKYKDFKSNFYQSNDPRAFSLDLMTPEERTSLKKSLGSPSSQAYKKFVRSYEAARQAGVLSPANDGQ